MDKLVIRKAKLEELKIIQDLNHDLFASDSERDQYLNHNWPYEDGEDYFKKRIAGDPGICLVAEINTEIVGYLAGNICAVENWRPVKRTELENIFVKKDFRSQGVGAKLVSEFIGWSKDQGVTIILVVAYATNDQAIKFYQREGFLPEALSLEMKIDSK